MKFYFNVFSSWGTSDWYVWRIIHWFSITTLFEPRDEFNPFLELHLWVLNFDFRLMILKTNKED